MRGIELSEFMSIATSQKIDGSREEAFDIEDRNKVSNLVAKLTDNDFLTKFDLVFRAGRIKMNYGTYDELILPEELKSLMKVSTI
jgi:hypothetical protein